MLIDEIYALWQNALIDVCCIGLVACGLLVFLRNFAPLWDELWRKWLKLDGLGKSVVVSAILGATLYGGAKSGLPWHRVHSDGADEGIGLVGVFTQVSNDVQTVGGVTVTNQIPLLAVMWTNGTVTASTPVSYRRSNTNDWTELSGIVPTQYAEGTTNVLQYVLSSELNYPFWWVGVDKPSVIITTSHITIVSKVATSQFFRLEWSCNQPLATTFDIYCKKLTDIEWTHVMQTANNYIQLTGFYVDKDLEWKVTSTYLEDGE